MKNYNPINERKVEIVHIANGRIVKNHFIAESIVELTLRDCNSNARAGEWLRGAIKK